ncbi:MAG: G5 domain-containing protein [Candidatus Saccharibacteria bacterium GW2011_GWA2_46_10]|nr:MAG: G5 domain-containing protein [Candidatus Saccharibacteria bacterium GW2011_GWA2_46_10]
MLGRLVGWFAALSTIGKVGLVTAASVGTIAVVGAPSNSPNSSSQPAPTVQGEQTKIEKKNETKTEPIPFESKTVDDPTLASGTEKVTTEGVDGIKTLTYDVTFTNGVETDRRQIKVEITRQPVTNIITRGTKVISNCDPNYTGCVPIASDVDCAGGSGNGPAYVSGPISVIGSDIYDLDRDNDGIACE